MRPVAMTIKSVDDSDDVVVVSEVNPRKRPKISQQMEKDFDDDCVILDGDPDKQLVIVNEPVTESDELLIVGEKGQVACRDFPHSRQHCAKFPFNSTPHESHCDLCHCYVCDSIAPCIHWGDGCLNMDHCHATEKEETWKILRKSLMLGKSSRSSVFKLPDTLHSMLQPQLNQVTHMNQIKRYNQVLHHISGWPSTILQSTSNSVLQNQVSRPTPFRSCAASTTFGVPSVKSHGAGYQPQVLAKNRGQQHLAPQQLVGLSSDIVRKEKDRNVGNLGTQFVPSYAQGLFNQPLPQALLAQPQAQLAQPQLLLTQPKAQLTQSRALFAQPPQAQVTPATGNMSTPLAPMPTTPEEMQAAFQAFLMTNYNPVAQGTPHPPAAAQAPQQVSCYPQHQHQFYQTPYAGTQAQPTTTIPMAGNVTDPTMTFLLEEVRKFFEQMKRNDR